MDSREELEKIIKEKNELRSYLKQIEENLTYLTKEREYLEPNVQKYKELRLGELMNRRKKIEYLMITQAKSAKAEKKYLEKLVSIERKIKENAPLLEAYRRYSNVIKQIELLTKQKQEMETKIEELDNRINEMIKSMKTNKRPKPKSKEKQEVSEQAPKKDYISLEDLL